MIIYNILLVPEGVYFLELCCFASHCVGCKFLQIACVSMDSKWLIRHSLSHTLQNLDALEVAGEGWDVSRMLVKLCIYGCKHDERSKKDIHRLTHVAAAMKIDIYHTLKRLTVCGFISECVLCDRLWLYEQDYWQISLALSTQVELVQLQGFLLWLDCSCRSWRLAWRVT